MVKTDFGLLGFLPLLVAIGFAIWKKDVILSLFLAIWTGASLIKGNIFLGFTDSISTYIINKSLATSDEASIVVFGLLMGGVINIMRDLGGNRAIARAFTRRVRSGGGQLATFIMGLIIFFDDYGPPKSLQGKAGVYRGCDGGAGGGDCSLFDLGCDGAGIDRLLLERRQPDGGADPVDPLSILYPLYPDAGLRDYRVATRMGPHVTGGKKGENHRNAVCPGERATGGGGPGCG